MPQLPEPVLPGLPAGLLDLLLEAAAPQRLALVGGAVRDLLRHRLHDDPWTGLPDLDLVVEGEAEPASAVDAAPEVPAPDRAVAPLSGEPRSGVDDGGVGGVGDGGVGDDGVGVGGADHASAEQGGAQAGGAESCGDPAGGGGPEGQLAAAHRLGRRLRHRLGARGVPFYQEHAAYGTVELEVVLPSGALLLDVATARRETYPQPGRNPQVRFARLEDDLARRDFTINAMALVLQRAVAADGGSDRTLAPRPAEAVPGLLDPYGGRRDLAQRQLRFLHQHSVRNDPTRVLRGARYAARLGFELAPGCCRQLRQTLAHWPWPWHPGDAPGSAPPALGTRMRAELELLLEREPWQRGLAALQRWGGLTLLDPQLQRDRHWRRRLHWAVRFKVPLLPALLAVLPDPLPLAERLQLPHRQHRLLAGLRQLRPRLEALATAPAPAADPVFWSELLEEPGHGPEAVALALVAGLGPRRPLLRWWLRWRHLGAECSAASLIAAGVPPGPLLGERLRQSRRQRLQRQRL
ncbi:MAG: hypothetical protein ACKOXO_11225 [Cyanobium sp.]